MTEISHDLDSIIRDVVNLEPGIRVISSAPESKEQILGTRDYFRSDERFEIVSRLLVYGTDEIDRIVSADNLGNFGRRGAHVLMSAVRSDPSARVRHHAASALGRTGDPEGMQVLREALDDQDPGVQSAAAEALNVAAILSTVSSPETPVMKEISTTMPVTDESQLVVMRDLEGMRLMDVLSTVASERLDAGDYDGAVVAFTEIITLTPGNPKSHNGRGQAYERLGKFKESISDYSRAIELDAEYAWAYGNRARSYRRLEDWESALADIERAVVLDPSIPQFWYNLATTLLHFQELNKCLEAFNQALVLRPDYVEALMNRGVVRFQSGQYEDALSDFSQALTHDANRAACYLNRSLVYKALDRHKEAEDDLRKAWELDPVFMDQYRDQG